MSAPIDLQLRGYTEFFDSQLPALDLEDILIERLGTDVVRPLRPRRPRQQRQWLVAAAAAAAVLLLVGGFALLFRSTSRVAPVDQPTTIVPTTTLIPPTTIGPSTTLVPPTTVPPPSAAVEGEPGTGPQLSWVRADLPIELFEPPSLRSDGEQFYLIDRSTPAGAMFTSPDGLSWEPVPGAEGLPLGLMGMGGSWSVWSGRHLVVTDANSTEPGSTTELTVHRLAPGATATSQTIEPEIPAPNTTTLVNVVPALTAVGPMGYYVIGGLEVLDFGPLVAETLGAEFRDAVAFVQHDLSQETEAIIVQTTDGRRETIRAADVGLADAGWHHLAVPPSGLIGWYSPDGQEWVQVPQEGPFTGDFIPSLVGVDDGFLALGASGGVWFTADGITWELLPDPEIQGALAELIPWRGQALARVDDFATGQVLGVASATSLGVSPVPMSDTAPEASRYGNARAAGPAGIAYFTEVDPGGPFELVYSPDGANWNLGSLPDPTGEVYCCYVDLYGVAVGGDTVVVLEAASDGSGLSLWVGRPQP
jgi:hypothetical protein